MNMMQMGLVTLMVFGAMFVAGIQGYPSGLLQAERELLDEQLQQLDHVLKDAYLEALEEVLKRDYVPSMYRLSDASGRLVFSKILDGSLSKALLDTDDVFVIDTTEEVFVWVGANASQGEKSHAFEYTHNYLMTTPNPFASVTVVKEGMKTPAFLNAF